MQIKKDSWLNLISNVVQADSLSSDELDNEINRSLVIVAGSLFRFLSTTRVALLVLFIDCLNNEINIERVFVADSLSDQSSLINSESIRICNAHTRKACSDRVYCIW